MERYDTSKTSPDYEPPPRRLGSGIWLAGVIVCAVVFLGVFLWHGLGGQSSTPTTHQSAATTTGSPADASR